MDEPDSSSAAAKSSGDESTEKTTNKTLTTNTDPYDFDSQEALKKSKVVKLKIHIRFLLVSLLYSQCVKRYCFFRVPLPLRSFW